MYTDIQYLDAVKESHYFGRATVDTLFEKAFDISRSWELKDAWDGKKCVIFSGESGMMEQPLIFEFKFRPGELDFDLANIYVGDFSNNANEIMGEFIFMMKFQHSEQPLSEIYETIHMSSDTPDWIGRTGLRRYEITDGINLLKHFYGNILYIKPDFKNNKELSDGSPVYRFTFEKDGKTEYAYIDYTNKYVSDDNDNLYLFTEELVDQLNRDYLPETKKDLIKEEERYIEAVKGSQCLGVNTVGEMFSKTFNIFQSWRMYLDNKGNKYVHFIGESTFFDDTLMFEFTIDDAMKNIELLRVYQEGSAPTDEFKNRIVAKLENICEAEDESYSPEFITGTEEWAIRADEFYDNTVKESLAQYLFGIDTITDLEKGQLQDMELDDNLKGILAANNE